ncbi:MarR family transcriptional regulator [Rhizorhabdus wittichii]|uniref:MarR family transcriptional regulator n=1 Tax=Rhizorhabdus wittichii TaxID=160791 RepID=A0A975CZM2_9SPHN|nr:MULTISPECIES: MarR family transcriptional regulator [Sphingomonadaceae]QTH20223.1 MarR family transcriptional regulator [Rhizorhabdus wittichii]
MTRASPDPSQFNLEMFLPHRIACLHDLTQTVLAGALSELGLTVAHWRVLHCLAQLGPSDLNSIAAFTVLQQSTLSRSVAKLGQFGLVSIDRLEGDRRHLDVLITEKGLAKLSEAIDIVTTRLRETFSLSDREEGSLIREINRIVDTLVVRQARR